MFYTHLCYFGVRLLLGYYNKEVIMSSHTGQMWNTLWPSLERMSEKLEEFGC